MRIRIEPVMKRSFSTLAESCQDIWKEICAQNELKGVHNLIMWYGLLETVFQSRTAFEYGDPVEMSRSPLLPYCFHQHRHELRLDSWTPLEPQRS